MSKFTWPNNTLGTWAFDIKPHETSNPVVDAWLWTDDVTGKPYIAFFPQKIDTDGLQVTDYDNELARFEITPVNQED